jgi:Leu/Phe-tRNA-protein transferase
MKEFLLEKPCLMKIKLNNLTFLMFKPSLQMTFHFSLKMTMTKFVILIDNVKINKIKKKNSRKNFYFVSINNKFKIFIKIFIRRIKSF